MQFAQVKSTELMYVHKKGLQKELEKFERENKELKKQLLLQREKLRGGKFRKIKVFNENVFHFKFYHFLASSLLF